MTMRLEASLISSFPSLIKENIFPSLRLQQKKVMAFAAIIFGSVAICYFIIRACLFKGGVNEDAEDIQLLFAKEHPLNISKDFDDLQKKIGLIASKYQPKQERLEILEKIGNNKKFSRSFAQRYPGISTAPEIFKKGFSVALKEIFKMADQGKLQINRSLGTPTSRSGSVVYRWLALDWIKGGKLEKSCHGYELYLNDNKMKLVSSIPENVLKCQHVQGESQPAIIVHFGARCDFIPGEEVLKYTSAACGVDPISAKCLWVQLSRNDKKHFSNWILEPAMDDTYPDYIAAVDYIEKRPGHRKHELFILRDLIDDMAVALEVKFRQDFAMSEWGKYLDASDFELEPFIKKGSLYFSENLIDENVEEVSFVSWEPNFDVLSVTNLEGDVLQADFYALILNAKEKYQSYFKNLHPKLIQKPMAVGKIINSITLNQIKYQYYTSHELISQHGCLLSNFLAAVMIRKKDLTSDNIDKLKYAMAAYLDDPEHALHFEGALSNDFECSVPKFQDWLRGKNDFLDSEDLTSTVLEIAAYTLAVRVVLFSPSFDSQDLVFTRGKGDEYGRLMPVEDVVGHYLGPCTKEVFFMAIEDDYSFFGLFPKINVNGVNPQELGINASEWKDIVDLDNYWKNIDKDI